MLTETDRRIRSREAMQLASAIRAACLERGWDSGELAGRAGISRTTLYHLERAMIDRPRRSTIAKLAAAFGMPPEDLLTAAKGRATERQPFGDNGFDRSTNPLVEDVCQQMPRLFRGWTADEWDELYSSFGTGGALTRSGVVETAARINRRRETVQRLSIVLETHLAEVAERMVETLYELVQPASLTPDSSFDEED